MAFNRDAYHDFLLEKGAVGFFPEKITLTSGRKSYWYFNGRRLIDFAPDMKRTVRFILDFCEHYRLMPDYFLAVPEGVTKIAPLLNMELGGKQVHLRAVPKEHGEEIDRHFVGPAEPGDKVILLEDVTTTGGSLMSRLMNLLEAGLKVETLCECNRKEKARLDGKDMDFGVNHAVWEISGNRASHHSMTTAELILIRAYERIKPGEHIAQGILEEYEDHGVVGIRLA